VDPPAVRTDSDRGSAVRTGRGAVTRTTEPSTAAVNSKVTAAPAMGPAAGPGAVRVSTALSDSACPSRIVEAGALIARAVVATATSIVLVSLAPVWTGRSAAPPHSKDTRAMSRPAQRGSGRERLRQEAGVPA
jgi:hypothetical protein